MMNNNRTREIIMINKNKTREIIMINNHETSKNTTLKPKKVRRAENLPLLDLDGRHRCI
jgi:hypothetical protein